MKNDAFNKLYVHNVWKRPDQRPYKAYSSIFEVGKEYHPLWRVEYEPMDKKLSNNDEVVAYKTNNPKGDKFTIGTNIQGPLFSCEVKFNGDTIAEITQKNHVLVKTTKTSVVRELFNVNTKDGKHYILEVKKPLSVITKRGEFRLGSITDPASEETIVKISGFYSDGVLLKYAVTSEMEEPKMIYVMILYAYIVWNEKTYYGDYTHPSIVDSSGKFIDTRSLYTKLHYKKNKKRAFVLK